MYPGIITGLSGGNFDKTNSVCGIAVAVVLIAYSFAATRLREIFLMLINIAALTSTVKESFGLNDFLRRKRYPSECFTLLKHCFKSVANIVNYYCN